MNTSDLENQGKLYIWSYLLSQIFQQISEVTFEHGLPDEDKQKVAACLRSAFDVCQRLPNKEQLNLHFHVGGDESPVEWTFDVVVRRRERTED